VEIDKMQLSKYIEKRIYVDVKEILSKLNKEKKKSKKETLETLNRKLNKLSESYLSEFLCYGSFNVKK
jgi:hypothetical protein